MTPDQPGNDEQTSAAWAPYDYTDGKKKGQWKTSYPSDARTAIKRETAYLVILFLGCLGGVFYVIVCNDLTPLAGEPRATTEKEPLIVGFLGALFAGTLGGCCFGLKCMYHFVAKLMWHEDRRLWRILSPPLSGVVSLFMVLMVASGLIQIFDGSFVSHPIRVMAFSFLVGYFSDKALAKMAEVADTLFGDSKKDGKKSESTAVGSGE